MRIGKFAAGLWAACLSIGCGDDASGSGALTVQVSAEASISEGLSVGQDEENSRDYAVTFSKYLVAVGRVTLGRSGQADRRDERVFVADLLRVGEQGAQLFGLNDLASGRWEKLSFETPITPAGATPVAGVTPADLQVMIDKQLTYWIEGTVQRADKPVRFVFQVGAPARFAECQTDARPGVAVPDDGRTAVSLTLHGDHLFFNQFLTGDEGTITRQAKWIADADVDGDGLVVTEDLSKPLPELATERLFPSAAGYQLREGPYGPITNALDFVRAQLATQGHVNGEGECVWEPL
ncbi:MAG: hypothetical protein ABW252_08890 [Polyangiales bacterium]